MEMNGRNDESQMEIIKLEWKIIKLEWKIMEIEWKIMENYCDRGRTFRVPETQVSD